MFVYVMNIDEYLCLVKSSYHFYLLHFIEGLLRIILRVTPIYSPFHSTLGK